MAYTRVNWEDLPSTNTPINATNLNKMDEGIEDNSFESSSNANGRYIKFADGTMICYGTGSVQLASGVGYELIAFPASFVSTSVNTDIVILGTVITLDGSSSLTVREMIINCRANSNSNFYAYIKHSTSTSTSYLVGFNYMAIGRWK